MPLFGLGTPITKLPRDDVRAIRFLHQLSSELKVAALHRRLQLLDARERPTWYIDEMHLALEDIIDRYEAADYDAADLLIRKLSNRVAHLHDRDPYRPEEAQRQGEEDERQLISLWKASWKLAKDPATSRRIVEGNTERSKAKLAELNERHPSDRASRGEIRRRWRDRQREAGLPTR